MSRPFPARYPGKCPTCAEPIEPGDSLTYDEDDVVVHAACATQARATYRPPTICDRCHLTMPCDCEED